jgi:hypothetical protein
VAAFFPSHSDNVENAIDMERLGATIRNRELYEAFIEFADHEAPPRRPPLGVPGKIVSRPVTPASDLSSGSSKSMRRHSTFEQFSDGGYDSAHFENYPSSIATSTQAPPPSPIEEMPTAGAGDTRPESVPEVHVTPDNVLATPGQTQSQGDVVPPVAAVQDTNPPIEPIPEFDINAEFSWLAAKLDKHDAFSND